jgi:hypothetical protein
VNRVIISLLIFFVFVFAQPDTLWTKIYGDSENDMGRRFEETADMGFIIAGSTHSFGTDGALWLIKTNSIGDTIWTKIYDDTLTQAGLDVKPTDDGYVVLGLTSSLATRYDIWLLKTNASGDTLWTRTYGGDLVEEPYTVSVTNEKGYFIVAETESFRDRQIYGYLIRTDSLGDTLWTRVVDGCSKAGIVTNDGNFAITGTKNLDAWLAKVDQNGGITWEQTYGHWNGELTNDVFQTADGGYILTGYTSSFGGPPTRWDVYLVKTDSLGNLIWDKNINISEYDYTFSVRPTTDDGYIICGFTGTVSSLVRDLLIIKTDSNGDTLWTRVYGGNDWEYGFCVRQISDGNYVAVGYTESFGAGERDLWLLKIGSLPGITEKEVASGKSSFFAATILSGPLRLPKEKTCRVFDITGRVVAPEYITPGIYFIQVDRKIVRKVVKIR